MRKTSAAQQLGVILKIPVHNVDEEIGFVPAHQAPWRNRTPAEQQVIAQEICQSPRWIIDGAYSSWRPYVLKRCDIIVGLDYHPALSFYRLLTRTTRRIIYRTPCCNGNIETVHGTFFSPDSILLWHATTFSRRRKTMRSWAKDPDAPPTIIINKPGDFTALIKELRSHTL